MPQCPHCQTDFESGQRYCQKCGSFLLHPEEGNKFCPQCDVRVSPKQEFCHECDAPLKGQAAAAAAAAPEAAPPAAPPPGTPAKGPKPLITGLLIVVGVIVLFLLIMLFTRGTCPPPAPPPPAPKAEAPAPAAPPAPAPAPEAKAPAPAPEAKAPDLNEQLQKVLATLREAQLNKDVFQYLNVYSLTFPDLDEKRKDTATAWETFDYTNLVFTLDEVKPIDADNAVAQVTWYVDTRNRRTQELASVKQTFQVRFAKELGQWRIRSLEEME